MDVDTVLKTGEALLFVDVGPKVWPTAGSGVSQPQAAGKVTAKSTNKAGDDKETTDKPAAKAAEPTVAVSPAPVAAAAPAAPTVVPTAPASDATSVAPDPSSMPSAGIRLAQNVIEPAVKSPGDQGAAVPDRQPAAANGTAALPLPEAKMDRTNVPQASTSAPPPAPPANTPAKADANAPAKAASAQPAVGHAAPSQDVAAPAPAKLAPTDHDRQPAGDAPKTGPDTTTQPLNVIQTAAPSSNAATVAAAKPTDAATQSPIAVAVPIEGVAVAIASKAADGKKSFDIRLDPPDLGRIHVHLDVDSSGQITSHVIADRSDTLDLLRRDSSGLERAFQDAGLKTSSNGLQFSLRDQNQSQTGQQQQPMPSSHLIMADEPTIDTPAPVYRLLTGARGGLDIRV
jgi:chemotaxis protein MotD